MVVLVVVVRQVLHLAGVRRRPRRRACVISSDDIHNANAAVQIGCRYRAASRQVRGRRHKPLLRAHRTSVDSSLHPPNDVTWLQLRLKPAQLSVPNTERRHLVINNQQQQQQ